MRYKIMRRCASIFAVAALAPMPAFAQDLGQGVETVAVDDGLRRICIDATTDRVSVRLDRIVVAKSKTWFTEDRAVDIVIDGKLAKRDNNFVVSHAEMPVVFRANIDEYESGTVVTPVQISLLSQFPLSLNDSTTSLLEIDFSFVNASESTVLTRVISQLPDAARGLPIPPTPYTEGFISVTSVLGGLLDTVLQDEDQQDSVSREGRISLEFNETGFCGRNGAYSGTYVFVKSFDGGEHGGVVSLDELQEYCFIKQEGISAVFIERRDMDGNCTYEYDQMMRLVNPHFTLVLSITNVTGDTPKDREVAESGMAIRRSTQDDSPQKVAQIDELGLKKAFASAGREYAPTNLQEQSMQLAAGQITYLPSEELFVKSSYILHQIPPVVTSETKEMLPITEMTTDEILLNSIARCSAYGIDAYQCF